MGLLDDAIREHLELKKKHGAAEEEILRQETEALGPARRDFAPAPEPVEPDPGQPVAQVPPEPPLVEEAPPPPAPADFDDIDEDEPFADPSEPFADPRPASITQAPTEDFPAVAREPASEPEPEPLEDDPAEDVLEETPDFLQDTPEHDRLWFEQKPPRDFDFDD